MKLYVNINAPRVDAETNETVIYANFQGADPNKETVEINVRRMCFFPSKTGVSYITVSGFAISKAATTWAPPAAFQDGMIGPHWSKGWIIEDCDISNSKCSGISLGKYHDPENNHFFTYQYVKSPTQMERDAVCRGQRPLCHPGCGSGPQSDLRRSDRRWPGHHLALYPLPYAPPDGSHGLHDHPPRR